MNKNPDLKASNAKNIIRAMIVLMGMTASAGWAGSPGDAFTTLAALSAEDTTYANSGFSLPESINLESHDRGARRGFQLADVLPGCETCEIHLGVGGTYHAWKGTGGVVLPLTVSWHRNRYELGIFRFASEQTTPASDTGPEKLAANPYWGVSLSRRFKLLERGPFAAFFGFGVSYKTEQDVLSITHWNFASQLGLRLQPARSPVSFELSARHWSNGGVRTPNRGQDFTTLTVRFDR